MSYLAEPPYTHGQARQPGVVLINLGTPDAPTAAALRPYLRQFLSDPRVVEIPRPVWWPILNGIILNVRPRKSAEKYASIWTPEGSPLKVHTEKQAKLLKGWLGEKTGVPIRVEYAMRYGNPSVESVLDRLKAEGCDRLLLIPAYPQYAASSTASAFDAAYRWLMHTRNQPALRTIRSYPDHPAYIDALAGNVRNHWQQHGKPDVLLMSFHGVPEYTLKKGDPYHCECHKTARLLAEALGLGATQWRISFQSRFGRAKWIEPYTDATLAALGKQGIDRVDVVAPGFTADCLETLEELAMEGRETFLEAGGKTFHYIPALNAHPRWIDALGTLALEHLAGWLPTHHDPDAESAERAASRARALALGARN